MPTTQTPTMPSMRESLARTDLPRMWTALIVVLLLGVHYALAFDSLRRENPTIDEIAHLPAGLSYWQKGTFKLYPHNPPLAKLVAALPVVLAQPVTQPLYNLGSWTNDPPSQANFGQSFAFLNAGRYFELFTQARAVMPLFSVVAGLFIFAWSSRLYTRVGGLLSLALWCFCPNVLAHARLVTSDIAGSALAVGATLTFWGYLRQPTWRRAILAGVMLGLAQLAKFSLILLYAYWPLLWLVGVILKRDFAAWPRNLGRDFLQGLAIVTISLATIDAGYGFEGVGKPLGSFNFTCRSLTRPIPSVPIAETPDSPNWMVESALRHRVNWFRNTGLDRIPAPLPYHFLMGFDAQRLESEGFPRNWIDPTADPAENTGYPVYLDGTLRSTGWWHYYLACLAYKVPEGTWILVFLSLLALGAGHRTSTSWFDEFAVLAFPAVILLAMSVLTDLNLGLRYILPVFPFVFVGVGKVVPWVGSMSSRWRRGMTAVVVIALSLTTAQTALIHPSYLASFNWVSGGPDRGSEHLIDSNLDWGQDLVTLQRWISEHRPGRSVGLVYFGQINPNIFALRGEEFSWFLPPVLPTSTQAMYQSPALIGPAKRLKPGVYAVSASLVRGLPWRVYDPGEPTLTWSVAWDTRFPGTFGPSADRTPGAFGYFSELTPSAKVGYSTFVYDVTESDCARINPRLAPQKGRNTP